MSRMSDLLKKSYRTAVPAFMRNTKSAHKIASFTAALLGHDAIYDAEYYANQVEGPAVRSSETMADSIYQQFQPKTVVDVGCGTGALLAGLRQRGCNQVFGLEYSEAALRFCRERGLDVQKFDLEMDRVTNHQSFDVAISIEVAEHLPTRIADSYVDLLTRLSDRIVFTAAPPGQGGRDHVNEQPPSYWIQKFAVRGFRLDEALSARWRREWETKEVEAWYVANLMLFLRHEAPPMS